MSKLFIALIIGLGSSIGFANPVDPNFPWVSIYETQDKANSPAGFEILQKKYPAVFGNYDSKTVSSADYTTRVYEYQGENTCPTNDPRLRFEASSYGLCQNSGNNGTCFQTAVRFQLGDPCAN